MTSLRQIVVNQGLSLEGIDWIDTWGRDYRQVSRLQLSAAYARIKMLEGRDRARSIIEAVQRGVSEIDSDSPLLLYRFPEREHMTIVAFRDTLLTLSRPRAVAILFAASVGCDLETAISLNWKDALAMRQSLSEFSWSLINAQPRHLRCDYVFWEGSPPGPLHGLAADVFEVFGMIWGELQASLGTMVMVDTAADWDAFKSAINLA